MQLGREERAYIITTYWKSSIYNLPVAIRLMKYGEPLKIKVYKKIKPLFVVKIDILERTVKSRNIILLRCDIKMCFSCYNKISGMIIYMVHYYLVSSQILNIK